MMIKKGLTPTPIQKKLVIKKGNQDTREVVPHSRRKKKVTRREMIRTRLQLRKSPMKRFEASSSSV